MVPLANTSYLVELHLARCSTSSRCIVAVFLSILAYQINLKLKSERIVLVLSILLWGISQAQEKPKLAVGIVVDKMRYDYVYRFGINLEIMALKN